MQPASFGWHSPTLHGHAFERQLPGFASPVNHGLQRQAIKPDLRSGDELTKTKKQRNAEAAIKDPILGILPQFKPFAWSYGDMEPVETVPKAFLSPVFLVDPMFTKD